ncbi:MAG TPA: glycosyltransferase [Paludibacteraceae bacterium]|nr:glycosyltransferase [Paludibacteraceae bacterium]
MKHIAPDYIFETSWEVCNKVGGIYTVLSTRARTLQTIFGDRLFFIGPDSADEKLSSDFIPTDDFADWVAYARENDNLNVRVGRWDVSGKPLVILVDFTPFLEEKNQIYGDFWMWFGVESLTAYGDYDEASMFGYASGKVIDSFITFNALGKKKIIAHFNEWMTAFGIFYVKHYLPQVATVFTTHATSMGRSIAGNHKPLYDYLNEYDGDQMARELNMVAKHSVEKLAAQLSDCFTTVSDITNRECKQLLNKPADVVTPNGFEDDFVPKGVRFTTARQNARAKLRQVAEALLGYELKDNALFISTSGRYEYKNKGIDAFIESLKLLSQKSLSREVVAFILVPGWSYGARQDLSQKLKNRTKKTLENPYSTHTLVEPWNDSVMNALQWFHLTNRENELVKVIFVPTYLNGVDGIFNMPYYDLLVGFDLTVYPSYYEPWGYTPLESVAFGIPTITTDLSGFGQWVSSTPQAITTGVGIVHRSDYNYHDVVRTITEMMLDYANLSEIEQKKIKTKTLAIAQKALWTEFIDFYYDAYTIALTKKKK